MKRINFVLFCFLFFVEKSSEIGSLVKPGCVNNYNGTTNELKQIFIGRCYYFLNVLQINNCNINGKSYDCNMIWNEFFNLIVGKDPCSLKLTDFDQLIEMTDHYIGANNSLFWSGTYTPAHDLTKKREFWSLEDTFIGYLFNELTFCSRNSLNDFSYDFCPFDCVLSNSSFWNAASKNFAKKALGSVNVVLNGSRSFGAISNRSTFVNYELTELKNDKITQVKVLLLHAPDQPKYETCKEPKTLIYLENILKEKEISYSCEDNPDNILLLMCFYDPFSKECQAIKYLLNNASSNASNFYLLSININYIICFIHFFLIFR